LISAESEWVDVYAFAQVLLDSHEEARALIDEVRRRAGAAPGACGDLHSQPMSEIDRLADRTGWRPVKDYRAAVKTAAGCLCLGESRVDVVRELASRTGYMLERPLGNTGPEGPSPAVASKAGADLTGDHSWQAGATANRQARYRYLSTTAIRPDRRRRFGFNKDPL
jgi:hypothetical protein